MDDLDRTAIREPLAPVTGRANRRPIAAVIVAALVVLAIAVPKPWTPATPVVAVPAGSPDESRLDESAGSESSDRPADSYEPLRSICGSPGDWRAATLHHWPNRHSPIRTWSAIELASASGPEDDGIPFVDVAAAVSALGYCSPRGPTAAPYDTRAEIWALRPGGPSRLDAELLEPDEPHPLGGFWGPPPAARATILGVDAWEPGSYVIRLQGTAFDRWLGIEIRELPGPPESEPSATPTPVDPATPAPSATGS